MQDKKPPVRLTAGMWQPVTAREMRETASSTSRTRQNDPVPAQKAAVNRHTEPDIQRSPTENHPKRHGSETRQLALVAGRIAPHLKTQVLKLAKEKGWSESKTVADLVEQALANDLGKSFAVSLTNTLREALTTQVRKEYNRAANLALEAFDSAEEGRMLNIYILRLMLGDDDLLEKIVEDVRSEAGESLKCYSYAYTEAPEREEAYREQRMEEVN